MNKRVEFEELLGKTIVSIQGAFKGGTEVTIGTSDGCMYEMYHVQDCCEDVWLEDITGNIEDLLNSPITMAEEVSQKGEAKGDVSATWTFYKLATINGYVTLRWVGESNGYYGEEVDFFKVS